VWAEYQQDGETSSEGCEECHADFVDGPVSTMAEWQYQAREFCDLILTGGDTKKFWDTIWG
jgi:hypothetical protein